LLKQIKDMKNQSLQKVREILNVLRKDAEMALNGEWDTTTDEGIETGFGAQIEVIDSALYLIDNQPETIQVDVAFHYEDESEVIKIYDVEGMRSEFESKLNKLINP
jgi:hypothetical protein